jgi:tetratricopeptide (TPR) repeat protein
MSTGTPELQLEVAIARVGLRDPSRLADCRKAIAGYRSLEQLYPRAVLGVQHRLRRFALELTDYWCSLVEGDLAGADLAIWQCDAAAEACRVPQLRCAVDLLRATRALADGRLDDAATSIERLRPNTQLDGGLGLAWLFCSLMVVEAQERPELDALVSVSDPSMLDRLPERQRTGASAWSAAFFARNGNASAARAFLRRIPPEDLERMPSRHGDLAILCGLAETCWQLGEVADAATLYARLAPHAGLNAVGVAFDYKGSVAHYLGMLALLLGRPTEAVDHLRAALAFNRKLGMQAQLKRTRDLLAHASSLT